MSLTATSKNVVLLLGSRSIKIGYEGAHHPLGTFSVHNFAEPQNYKTEALYRDHSMDWSKIVCNNTETVTQNHMKNDLDCFQYLFYPDLSVYDSLDKFRSDLKIHLRKILTKIFYKVGIPTINTKVILAIDVLFPKIYIETTTDLLIKHFLMRAIVIVPTPLMVTLASGSSSGLIIDIGWSVTKINVVYDNRLLENFSKITNRAGRMIHYQLLSVLESRNYDLSKITFKDIEHAIMELSSITDNESRLVSCGPYFLHANLLTNAIKTVLVPEENTLCESDDRYIEDLAIELIEQLPIDLKNIIAKRTIITGGFSNIKGFNQMIIGRIVSLNRNLESIDTIGAWCGASLYSTFLKQLKKKNHLWEIRKEE
ncbi:unnamed protein product [Pichia kudriavzevii]